MITVMRVFTLILSPIPCHISFLNVLYTQTNGMVTDWDRSQVYKDIRHVLSMVSTPTYTRETPWLSNAEIECKELVNNFSFSFLLHVLCKTLLDKDKSVLAVYWLYCPVLKILSFYYMYYHCIVWHVGGRTINWDHRLAF